MQPIKPTRVLRWSSRSARGLLTATFMWAVVGQGTALGEAIRIYWTDSNLRKIQRADVDGTNKNVVTLVDTPSPGGPQGIALDLRAGHMHMYWTNSSQKTIRRANLDGAGEVIDVLTGLEACRAIALDLVNEYVYWTADGAGKIQRAKLDGSGPIEDLVVGSDKIQDSVGLALDVARGHMYWTDSNLRKIQRAGLEIPPGETPATRTDIEELVTTTSPGGPQGIALDFGAEHMYWTNSSQKTIRRANLDGTGEVDFRTGLEAARAIVLDFVNGYVYWTADGAGKIQRTKLDGSGPIEDLVVGFDKVQDSVGLALYIPAGPSTAMDFDDDGDVDLTDYGQFLACYNGPGNTYPALSPCPEADTDNDGDVDLSDYGVFLGCYNGPNNPPACE